MARWQPRKGDVAPSKRIEPTADEWDDLDQEEVTPRADSPREANTTGQEDTPTTTQ